MKSNFFLRLIILCLLLCAPQTLRAAVITETEASAWAEDKGRELLRAFSEPDLSARYQKLDDMFLNHVDLDYIAKFVMGKYWRQMTPAQRELYVPLFKRYSLAIYKSFPLEFARNVDFKINRVKIQKNYADVFTGITLKPASEAPSPDEIQTFEVTFRLVKNNNRLQIIDIKLTESSLILSYRSRFYEMIMQSDGELEWFLEDLEMITASAEETNRRRLTETTR